MYRIRALVNAVICVTVVVVFLLIVSGVVAVSAQTGNPLDQNLTKLDQIIETLTPPPGDVTLTTPLVALANAQVAQCLFANVGTANQETTVRVLGPNGELLATNRATRGKGD